MRPPRAISNDVDAVEERRPGLDGHVLARGVEDVVVDGVALDHFAVAEDPVLAVHDDVTALDVVRHERGNAGAEIDVAAFGQQGRRAARHLGARPGGFAVVLLRHVGRAAAGRAALVGGDGGFDDAGHEDARDADVLGRDLADVDDLVHLDDGDLRGFGEARAEVPAAATDFGVADAVGAVGADEGVVHRQRVLEDVRLAVEVAHFLALGDRRADAGGGIEGRHASASGAHALDEDALRDQLDLDLASLDLLVGRACGCLVATRTTRSVC